MKLSPQQKGSNGTKKANDLIRYHRIFTRYWLKDNTYMN